MSIAGADPGLGGFGLVIQTSTEWLAFCHRKPGSAVPDASKALSLIDRYTEIVLWLVDILREYDVRVIAVEEPTVVVIKGRQNAKATAAVHAGFTLLVAAVAGLGQGRISIIPIHPQTTRRLLGLRAGATKKATVAEALRQANEPALDRHFATEAKCRSEHQGDALAVLMAAKKHPQYGVLFQQRS